MGDLTKEQQDAKDRKYAKESLIRGVNNKKHICETLRMIYDEVHEMPDSDTKTNMTELLIDAMSMAKKMQNRLSYYQKTYKDNTGNKAINIVRLAGSRQKNKIRKARII